jgi:hypothetical protein
MKIYDILYSEGYNYIVLPNGNIRITNIMGNSTDAPLIEDYLYSIIGHLVDDVEVFQNIDNSLIGLLTIY